ncbi:MAG: hypothetical protein M1820_007886 [Bogoriella megaspora]|nr:MAG: hypothetical protein M1820_007886 [Bogoriella megaspora]
MSNSPSQSLPDYPNPIFIPQSPTRRDAVDFGGSDKTNQYFFPTEAKHCLPPADDTPAGYPKLAEWIGLVPETAIFRRFGFLNSLNLLYMQAELKYLEEKLKNVQRRDNQTPGDEQWYTRDYFFLDDSKEEHGEQIRLIMDMREKLEKYNAALIQQSQILPMKSPSSFDLDYIQRFLVSKEMLPATLAGADCNTWGTVHKPKGYEPDIVMLRPREKTDILTKLVIEKGTSKFFSHGLGRFLKPSPVHGGLVGFEGSTLSRLTYIVTTALASLLPVASITVLYFINSPKLRLGFIAIFTVLLSISLALFTSAKRAEIFALTAAFSAVQVVFVQAGNGFHQVGD